MSENYIPVKLPSKCKVYEGVDPSQVTIRVLKGKDEKLIAEMTYENLDRKFNTVLKSVLKGVAPEKLTLGDRKFVLVWLAINSYGKLFPIELVCEHCVRKIMTEVDLSGFEVNELPDDYQQPYKLTLSDGKDIYVRLLTVEDELKVVDFEKTGANGWLFRYALGIVDQQLSDNQKVLMLEDMNVVDVAKVRAFHEEFDHGPVMEAPYKCGKCGGEGRVAVPFRIEMVFPYGPALKKHFGASK
jgi:hypothetical protein